MITNFKTITKSEDDTRMLAIRVAMQLKPNDILGLTGELGGGKTTFVQGLAQGLKISKDFMVSSPTFTFINEYPCENLFLYHMDFYRLKDSRDAESLGLFDYFFKNGICVIEWFERAQDLLPKNFLEIRFKHLSLTERSIEIISHE